jgi:hypothetical protein
MPAQLLGGQQVGLADRLMDKLCPGHHYSPLFAKQCSILATQDAFDSLKKVSRDTRSLVIFARVVFTYYKRKSVCQAVSVVDRLRLLHPPWTPGCWYRYVVQQERPRGTYVGSCELMSLL